MMRRKMLLIGLVAMLALLLAACGGEATPVAEGDLAAQTQTVPVGEGSYTDVSVEGLAMLMADDEASPLVNVHIPYEGEIPDTDLFIPYDEVAQNLDQLPADKDARIVLYCRSGSMSAQAARTLVDLGYTDVWNVDGGMIAWENSGRTLQSE